MIVWAVTISPGMFQVFCRVQILMSQCTERKGFDIC